MGLSRLVATAVVAASILGTEAGRDSNRKERVKRASAKVVQSVAIDEHGEVSTVEEVVAPVQPSTGKTQEQSGWSKFGNGVMHYGSVAGKWITNKTKEVAFKKECCCGKKEPLFHYVCVPTDSEQSKAASSDLFSMMFKTGDGLEALKAMPTKEKREIIPEERSHESKDREAAEAQTLDVEELAGLDFHAVTVHQCADAETAKANKETDVNEAQVETYKQLVDDSHLEDLAGNFYRFKLAGQTLEWHAEKPRFSVDQAIYEKVKDVATWRCIDEEFTVDIRADGTAGAACQQVEDCKKILKSTQCGPEGKHSLYKLHGRTDGTCEDLIRAQTCPNGGYSNSNIVTKKLYGDTKGMYSICECEGSTTCS